MTILPSISIDENSQTSIPYKGMSRDYLTCVIPNVSMAILKYFFKIYQFTLNTAIMQKRVC